MNYNGLASFTYDANGNHTGSSLGASSSYNAKDQTTSIRRLGGVPVDMAYRGAGQPERTAVKALGQPVVRFTHTVVGLTVERVADVDRHYMYDDTGQVLTQRSPTGTLYVLTDGLGSTVGLTDSEGRLVGGLEYSAFGETSKATGVADLMPLRFGGAYLDPTGLYKMGHRYYDPALGRFTQQDPIHDPLDPKQWNGYVYVGADPVNYFDPSGLGFCPLGKNPNGSCRGSGVVKKSVCVAKNLLSDAGDFIQRIMRNPNVGSLYAGGGALSIAAGYMLLETGIAALEPIAALLTVLGIALVGFAVLNAFDSCF